MTAIRPLWALLPALCAAKMRERYGKNIPLEERMISPAAMYESRLLVVVNQ